MRRLRTDDRAIEGLPVRLVIALVVGVAALSVMMGMIDEIRPPGMTEVSVEMSEDDAVIDPGRPEEVEIRVVEDDGEPVAGARVVVRGDTARLADGPIVSDRTGKDGTVELDVEPEMPDYQTEGKLTIEVKPPAGSDYVDNRKNTRILVIRGE